MTRWTLTNRQCSQKSNHPRSMGDKKLCQFCKKFSHKNVIVHENICFSNPKSRACKTCRFDDFDSEGRYCEKGKTENGKTVFNCEFWELRQ